MTTAFFLRTLMDISLYTSAFSFLASLFGQTAPLVAAQIVVSLCAGLCFSIKSLGEKRTIPSALRYLPVLAMAAAFFEVRSIADAVLLMPAVLYAAYLAIRKCEPPDYSSAIERFHLSWKVLLPVCFVEIVTGRWQAFTNLTAPSVFLCMLSSLFLLRMLRHDPSVFLQRSFRIRNDLSVGLVALASVLFSTSAAKQAGLAVIKGVWLYGVFPVMQLFVYLFTGIFHLLEGIIASVAGMFTAQTAVKTSDYMEELDLSEVMERSDEARAIDLTVLFEIGKGLLVLAVVAAAILLLRRLSRNRRAAKSASSNDVRESLSALAPSRPLIDLPPKDPGERVRWYYRKFLRLAQKRGLPSDESKTTAEIQRASRQFFDDAAQPLSTLRERYVLARYRPQEKTSPESAQTAKEAYLALKSTKAQ